ncbi:MAG: DUF2165 domain-containing protein [Acidimicrobiia bacterium]|nr:DUF2165 domain-containing protein [bacterium]MCY3651486.1 DUF2165 domain-containing protein [bacterium]MXZ07234.1 DUF2165 domain-containing protein [Acidimicrobiia bacterium]MYD04813.1 DUF2165 domain-containing protein [Acidimicrobiia bacterium]MYH55826.1 DUF2165 domain-containing protein [Acidimicrobiia bacterium]
MTSADISIVEIVFRLIPLLILLGTGAMGAIVVLNNLTAPSANMSFVRHIMTMDTTNMDQGTQWREIKSPFLHRAAYGSILVLEVAVTVLSLIGSYFLAINLGAGQVVWDEAKLFGYLGFLAALVVWFLIIQVVGAEWFVSWQSENWNAIRDSTRINLITLAGIIILRLA